MNDQLLHGGYCNNGEGISTNNDGSQGLKQQINQGSVISAAKVIELSVRSIVLCFRLIVSPFIHFKYTYMGGRVSVMSFLMFEKLRAGDKKYVYPKLDHAGRIIYTPEDGQVDTFIIDEVVHFIPLEFTKWGLGFSDKGKWELSFSDTRVTFWSRFLPLVFGSKPKQKSGWATAGQLPYKSISSILCTKHEGMCLIQLHFYRVNGKGVEWVGFAADPSTLEHCLKVLAKHLRVCSYIFGDQGSLSEIARLEEFRYASIVETQEKIEGQLFVQPWQSILLVPDNQFYPEEDKYVSNERQPLE